MVRAVLATQATQDRTGHERISERKRKRVQINSARNLNFIRIYFMPLTHNGIYNYISESTNKFHTKKTQLSVIKTRDNTKYLLLFFFPTKKT